MQHAAFEGSEAQFIQPFCIVVRAILEAARNHVNNQC